MRYSAHALRLVDILALVLAGTGVLCLLLAAWTAILLGDAGPSRYGQDPRLWIVGYATLGIAFTCLGVALNLRLIRVRGNGGREPVAGHCGSLPESPVRKPDTGPAPPQPPAA